MASCSEQFLKVSWNSVQRSWRRSGLEIGRDGRTDERTNERTKGRTDIRITIYPRNFVCGGYKKYPYHFWTRFSCSWITLIYLPDTLWFETHGITGGAVFAAGTRAVTGGTVVSYRTRVFTSRSNKPVLACAVTIATITWRRLVHNTLTTRLAVFAISVNKCNYISSKSLSRFNSCIVCCYCL